MSLLNMNFSYISKKLLYFHSYIVYKLVLRRKILNSKDIKKILHFSTLVLRKEYPAKIQEILFNVILSSTVKRNQKLQNEMAPLLPTLLQLLRKGQKVTRKVTILWTVIHALLLHNKFNLITFRQHNGVFIIKKYLKMFKLCKVPKNRKIYQCVKSVRRQLNNLTEFASKESRLEAKRKLLHEDKSLRRKIIALSSPNKNPTAPPHNDVYSLLQKSFFFRLPKVFGFNLEKIP